MNTIPSSVPHYNLAQKSTGIGLSDFRCPHGSPSGSCSICSGMGGGGGGGGATRRIPGLLNWGEAYALWKSIQNAKVQGEDDQKSRAIALLRQSAENQKALQPRAGIPTNFNQVIQSVNRFFASLLQTLKISDNNKTDTIQTPLKTVQSKLQELSEKGVLIADKLVAIFAEEIKLLRERLQERLQKIAQAILTGKFTEFLAMIAGVQDKVFHVLLPKQWENFKKAFKSLKSFFSTLNQQNI